MGEEEHRIRSCDGARRVDSSSIRIRNSAWRVECLTYIYIYMKREGERAGGGGAEYYIHAHGLRLHSTLLLLPTPPSA